MIARGRGMNGPLDKTIKNALDQAPIIAPSAGEPSVPLPRDGLAVDDFRR